MALTTVLLAFLSSLSLSSPHPLSLGRNPFLVVIYSQSTSDKFSPLPLFYVLCRISGALEYFASFSYDVFYEILIIIVYYYCVLIVCLGPSVLLSEQFINIIIFIIAIICTAFSYPSHLPSAPLLFYRPICYVPLCLLISQALQTLLSLFPLDFNALLFFFQGRTANHVPNAGAQRWRIPLWGSPAAAKGPTLGCSRQAEPTELGWGRTTAPNGAPQTHMEPHTQHRQSKGECPAAPIREPLAPPRALGAAEAVLGV